MQPVVLGTSLRSATASLFTRSRVRLLVLGLAVTSVTSAAALGCSDDTPTYPPGAVPTVRAASAVTVDPPRNDAGEIFGGCCSFTSTVTFELPAAEFIREAHVKWAGIDTPTWFQYPVIGNGSSPGAPESSGPRQVAFDGVVPAVLVANGAKLPFTVLLVSGRGEKSVAVGSVVTLTAKPQSR